MTIALLKRLLVRLGGVAPTLLLIACHSEPLSQRASGQGASPEVEHEGVGSLSLISNGNMETGFARGTVRGARSVQNFRIGTYPVTWQAFDACVAAGACAEADASECGKGAYLPYESDHVPDYAARAPQVPAACVGESQAEAYCKWAGGRLPTLDEWLLAARGSTPRRFAWGDQKTSCEQHPLSSEKVARETARAAPNAAVLRGPLLQRTATAPEVDAEGAFRACSRSGFNGSELSVGTHQQGASPFGVQDLLLLPGELLKTDGMAAFNACGLPFSHCVVSGLEPAAIDSVETFVQVPSEASPGGFRRTIGHAYAFRCVLPVSAGG